MIKNILVLVFVLGSIIYSVNLRPANIYTGNLESSFLSRMGISFFTNSKYPVEQVGQYIQDYLNGKLASTLILKPKQKEALKAFYEVNSFKPVFINNYSIDEALQLLKASEHHGFNAQSYNINRIEYLVDLYNTDSCNIEFIAELDMLLVAGVRKFCKHLLQGKLEPKDFNFSWNYQLRSIANIDSVILANINKDSIFYLEQVFQPKYFEYTVLKNAYVTLLNSGKQEYSKIHYPGFLLKPGDSSKYVLKLKKALAIRGFCNDSLSALFNQSLYQAIKDFQKTHGLRADGVPGKETYKALNWTKSKYLNTLKVNLERMRWLPDSIDVNSLVVNIPAYSLNLFSDSSVLFSTRLVVGKTKHKTPVFRSEIDYLVFNPCWTVPNSIAAKKMLPKLKRDSNYLQNRNMFVGLNGVECSTTGIDFSEYNEDNFPYKIYQRTGVGNALGKVKFMFDNSYSIYLHDTPSKSLFNKNHRALSHGCIRVQYAVELAKVLLYEINNHKRSVSYYLKKGYPEKVFLNKKVALNISYFTAWADKELAEPVFYNDIYLKDLELLNALESK